MSTLRMIVSVVYAPALFGVLLLVPAGTIAWWRAWIFLGVVFVLTAGAIASIYPDPGGLLEERFKPPIQEGQPVADRVLVIVLLVTFVGEVTFIPLDVFWWSLLGKPGMLVSSLGLALFVAGWCITGLALKANTFAVAVVRHQEERHQRVVDTGVYGVARHPMYAGSIPLFIGMPLWLESYAGALVALAPIAAVTVRVLVEERFLRRELPGYEAYMQRVRFRLIPGLW